MNVLEIVVSAGVGALAALLTSAVALRWRRQDTLRQWRADAYANFVKASHAAGHKLGRAVIDGSLNEHEDSMWHYDLDVGPHLRAVELVASDDVRNAAYGMRDAFQQFRERMREGVAYDTKEYWAAWRPFQEARARFAETARKDLRHF